MVNLKYIKMLRGKTKAGVNKVYRLKTRLHWPYNDTLLWHAEFIHFGRCEK